LEYHGGVHTKEALAFLFFIDGLRGKRYNVFTNTRLGGAMDRFVIKSDYKPTGDQPEAIKRLTNQINQDQKHNILLGVTGSGKTFTVANVIENVQKPTLVIAHNKTLAAQLASEFKEFFPDNSVEYFVSYYDYYQPEAYIAHSDTFIEKDASINDEIDKLRHSATSALFERKDVIIVASVSCIYGLGDPIDYSNMTLSIRPGMEKSRNDILRRLVDIQYSRNDMNFVRNTFRVRGDVIEVMPAYEYERAYRIELFGDEIERITEINALTGEIYGYRNHLTVYPASHYVTPPDKIEKAIEAIEIELENQINYFKDNNQLIEAQRIEQRTRYDMEMLREVGFCQGIENYSRVLSGRPPGSRPYTLIDYFPDDFLLVIDESHVTLPQIRAMYGGDKSRKTSLVNYGFRLPSAMDNRPLNFEEFESIVNQILYVSATPGPYEYDHAPSIVEQIIRPTGLLDPIIEVRPSKGQIDDLYGEIIAHVEKNERVLITTLTKKMAEDLTDYFKNMDIKIQYMHSDIKTFERMKIIHDLRSGVFDVLVGINLLREGLDLPEVSLIAILDADKEGFLRSETSLVQTIGRAARNVNGCVIMYADNLTKSMNFAISETNRRRSIQEKYNIDHQIEPKSIVKGIRDIIEATVAAESQAPYDIDQIGQMTKPEFNKHIEAIEKEMYEASKLLQFEKAAELRDLVVELKKQRKK